MEVEYRLGGGTTTVAGEEEEVLDDETTFLCAISLLLPALVPSGSL